jgi:hypothetical protein
MNAAARKSASVEPAKSAGVEASMASPMKASQTAAMEAGASRPTVEAAGNPTSVEPATARCCVKAPASRSSAETAPASSSVETAAPTAAASMRGVGEIRRWQRRDAQKSGRENLHGLTNPEPSAKAWHGDITAVGNDLVHAELLLYVGRLDGRAWGLFQADPWTGGRRAMKSDLIGGLTRFEPWLRQARERCSRRL